MSGCDGCLLRALGEKLGLRCTSHRRSQSTCAAAPGGLCRDAFNALGTLPNDSHPPPEHRHPSNPMTKMSSLFRRWQVRVGEGEGQRAEPSHCITVRLTRCPTLVNQLHGTLRPFQKPRSCPTPGACAGSVPCSRTTAASAARPQADAWLLFGASGAVSW